MSRPKGVGLAAFDRSRLTASHFASHGSSLKALNASALESQLSVFRTLVQNFAQTHAKDIRSDPSFRAQFARMCQAIGVDPLASSNRSDGGSSSSSSASGLGGASSIWGQMLGKSVNDFYFELAVKVVEVCGRTRGENGGLIGLGELTELISRSRPATASAISADDIRRAVETLAPLGGGFAIVTVGSKEYIRSVPRELSNDQASVVEAVQALGYVSVSMLMDNLGWEAVRAKTVIEDMMRGGMLWVDKQTGGEWEYWSPSGMVDGNDIFQGYG